MGYLFLFALRLGGPFGADVSGRTFTVSPALCAVVQRVLVLFTAC